MREQTHRNVVVAHFENGRYRAPATGAIQKPHHRLSRRSAPRLDLSVRGARLHGIKASASFVFLRLSGCLFLCASVFLRLCAPARVSLWYMMLLLSRARALSDLRLLPEEAHQQGRGTFAMPSSVREVVSSDVDLALPCHELG